MKCPFCGSEELGVLESRVNSDGESIRRRRECEKCHKRFTTYERVEGADLVVIKKDGRREAYDREKLRRGLIKATWKRPVTLQQIEGLIDGVEQKLKKKGTTEIKSWEIGNLTINKLKRLDPVGYLLFASVYRDFQSLKDFEDELKELKRIKVIKPKKAKMSAQQRLRLNAIEYYGRAN